MFICWLGQWWWGWWWGRLGEANVDECLEGSEADTVHDELIDDRGTKSPLQGSDAFETCNGPSGMEEVAVGYFVGAFCLEFALCVCMSDCVGCVCVCKCLCVCVEICK